jgi:hypothetical protein
MGGRGLDLGLTRVLGAPTPLRYGLNWCLNCKFQTFDKLKMFGLGCFLIFLSLCSLSNSLASVEIIRQDIHFGDYFI